MCIGPLRPGGREEVYKTTNTIMLMIYGRFPKFHRVFLGRDPGALKSDIVSKKHPQLIIVMIICYTKFYNTHDNMVYTYS